MNWRNFFPDYKSDFEEIDGLNQKISDFTGVKYSCAVANGTIAIEVALKALSFEIGQKVLVPSISFVATASAVANCGLIPVYYDFSIIGATDTLQEIKNAWNEQIRCIIVVHFAGIINRDIEEIAKFCKQKNIALIEDCAQALGTYYNDRHAGSFGTISTLSFQSSKLVEAGEGGAIISNSKELILSCSRIVDWGLSRINWDRDFSLTASNFRISGCQAYLLNKQFEQIGSLICFHKEKYKLIYGKMKDMIVNARADEKADDCLFFIITKNQIKSSGPLYPLGEYPMYRSKLVKSIIKRLYPQNYQEYLNLVSDAEDNYKISLCEVENYNYYRVKEFEL
jgi:perosamine synthetase